MEENEVRFTINESLIRPGTSISRRNEVRAQLMAALEKAVTFIGLGPNA